MRTENGNYSLFRIELTTGGVHGSYWMSACAMSGFTAIYLGYLGFSNVQIGLTSSMIYLLTMLLQIVVADFSDAHFSIPLKTIISAMYLAAIVCAAAVNFLPLPIAVMMVVYSLAQTFSSGIDCFISAMIVQFNNLGVPIRYGWPRSFGSVLYAVTAIVIGFAIERYSAAFLLPLFMILAALAIFFIMLVPAPKQYASPELIAIYTDGEKRKKISLIEMLRDNKTLVLLVITLFISAAGYNPSFIFAIRIFERLGGGSSNVGINSFCSAFMELPALVLSSLLMKKFDCRKLLTFTLLFHFLRLVLLRVTGSVLPIYIISCFQGMNNGIYMVATMNFANDIVRDGEKVRAQSALAFSKTLGSVVGNSISGVLIDAGGVPLMLSVGIVMCLAAVCMMAFVVVPMSKKLVNR